MKKLECVNIYERQWDVHISAGPSLERVPRVPRHPLRFGNGCQAPVLTRGEIHGTEKNHKNHTTTDLF